MVTGNRSQAHEEGPTRSGGGGGPSISAQSVSTSGSAVSPSNHSEPTTPACDTTSLRLHHLEISEEDSGCNTASVGKKKKRGQQLTTGADKNGRGLREFSKKVYEKVESKGTTTYNEVADELVAEYADENKALGFGDQRLDEKNIRRRVYDALNVLMAMDILYKDKKEIHWRGLPHNSFNDIEKLETERRGLESRVQSKDAYLRELQDQFQGYQNLILKNQEIHGSGNASRGGVAVPFILVQTRPNATVEVEISEDMQLVHFDFNSTPFALHDDKYVLKQMKLCEKAQ